MRKEILEEGPGAGDDGGRARVRIGRLENFKSGSFRLREDLLYDFSVDVGEAEVSALEEAKSEWVSS